MQKSIITILLLVVALFIAINVKNFVKKVEQVPTPTPEVVTEDPVICTMDAMMCPDGSYVGRSGPKCEFKCPPTVPIETPSPTTTTLIVGLNEPVTKDTVLTVTKVLEDSRCPSDVQCIQAGRVRIELNVQSSLGTYKIEIGTGKTVASEELSITLDDVTPYPISTSEIKPDQYKFKFTIVKK